VSGALPLVFIALSGLALSAVLYALWQSLRLLLDARDVEPSVGPLSDAERDALLAEKRELLTTIRDVQFERDLGKISQRDFERLDRRYRTRAREVLEELDHQLSPYRAKAQVLLEEAIGAAASEPEPEHESRACPACDQVNDADAVFCKKCAHRLIAEGDA
jgi:hypothetical protein